LRRRSKQKALGDDGVNLAARSKEEAMADMKPSKRWVVRGRRVLVLLLLLVIALLALRAVFDIWMGRRLNDEIARIEKHYGPLRYDPVRKLDAWKKWPDRLAPDNRARVLDAAAASITVNSERVHLNLINAAIRTPKGDVAREIAEQNRDVVQLAIRASRLRHSNWDISYIGELDNVPNLMDHRNLSKVLVAAAETDADAGRADDALADLTAGFAQAAAMRSEPAPVMMVNAAATAGEQVDALKDILDRTEPSGAALASLQAAIEENLDGNPARPALLGELKHSRAQWSLVASGWLFGRRFLDHSTPTPPSWWMRAVSWLFRPVIRYMAVRDLADRARAVDAASVPRTERAKDMLPPPEVWSMSPSWRPSVIQMAAGLIAGGDHSLAQVGLSDIAVALRRFRLDHGAYPNALDELVPTYFKAVPLDPFTGRQPDYTREGTGFTLRAHIPVHPLPPGAIRVPGYRDPSEWKLSR
jgi:hypothetical protein